MKSGDPVSVDHAREIASGERFEFGENWNQFLQVVDEGRIQQAVDSLKEMLAVENLEGKSFLDAGSGSGLFSLAASRLGANVCSFDYDPQSVACTRELKRRYFEGTGQWRIERGSVLDPAFLRTLGKFDIIYSWGVLHHTGDMWAALANVENNAAAGGKLFISIYNDQGRMSKVWWWVKKAYVSMPKHLRWLVVLPCYVVLWGPVTLRDFVFLRPFETWRTYRKHRGMSAHHDMIDWVGGFPFEVAKPEAIFEFYKKRGYQLTKLFTCAGGLGCNQFVFERVITTLLRHFDTRRIDPVLVVVDLRNAAYLSELPPTLQVIDLGFKRVRYALPSLIRLIRRLRPQVVFSTLGHLNAALGAARSLLGDAVLICRETTVPSLRNASAGISYLNPLYRWAFRRMDRIICQSSGMRDDLIRSFSVDPDRCVTIGNPVDLERVRSELQPRAPRSAEDQTRFDFVAAGRLSREKGFDLLIEALALLRDPRVHVRVIGKGPLMDTLTALARDRGVSGQIAFVGFSRAPYAEFARADAFVLSSRYEGFPNAALEALACGTPVIAMPAPGGTRDLLSPIASCEIAAEVSAPALAAAIAQWLIRKPGRVHEESVALYSAPSIARRYEDAIASSIGA